MFWHTSFAAAAWRRARSTICASLEPSPPDNANWEVEEDEEDEEEDKEEEEED